MTSERLLNMSIEVLYLPKNFYTPPQKKQFWLRPCMYRFLLFFCSMTLHAMRACVTLRASRICSYIRIYGVSRACLLILARYNAALNCAFVAVLRLLHAWTSGKWVGLYMQKYILPSARSSPNSTAFLNPNWIGDLCETTGKLRRSRLCTAWVKKMPPEVFGHFSQTVGNFYFKFYTLILRSNLR